MNTNMPYSRIMSVREQVQERIDKMDEAALESVLEQIERIEKSRSRFSPEFFDALNASHERNKDLSGEEALEIASEAVNESRQKRR